MPIDINSDPVEIAQVFAQLPDAIALALIDYPGLAEAVVEARKLPMLSADFVPQQLVFRFDQVPVLIWRDGEIVEVLEGINPNDPIEEFEIELDDDLAFVLVDRTVCLDRLAQVNLPEEVRSYAHC
jgi:hypothetical protein